jgi:hypothetical protein
MAAAIIPVLAPLIPTLANELVTFIANLAHSHAAAAQVTKAPGTGPAVFADVLLAVQNSLIKTHAAGQLPGDIPDMAIVKIIIQAVYTVMQLPSPAMLTAATATVPITGVATTMNAKTLVLRSGESLTISAG